MRCLVAGIEQPRRKAAATLDSQEQDVGEILFPVHPGEAARFWLSHFAARRGCAYDAAENADGGAFCRVRERVAQWWEDRCRRFRRRGPRSRSDSARLVTPQARGPRMAATVGG